MQRLRAKLANLLVIAAVAGLITPRCVDAEDVNVLFLGSGGHHLPEERFRQVQATMSARGVHLQYTDDMASITPEHLAKYDALLLFANIDNIEPAQADAILRFVEGGGGFVPLHCATYCFRNSPEMIALTGAQFHKHTWGSFRTRIAEGDHPIMKGFGGFESEDETYVHHMHNERNRTVLSYRVEGDHSEPWTWVRTQGKGRVFYTAWGHDHRTWGNPGFQNLLERGIRWASGNDPSEVPTYMNDRSFDVLTTTPHRQDAPKFEYVDVGPKIPNYPPSSRWGVQEEPHTKMQLPLPGDKSIGHFVTPVDFHVDLFADESHGLTKAIAMNWDEQGRLWVCVTVDYPNELQPRGQGRDKIVVLEDSDRDGNADASTVFANGLSIPTAIVAYRGGVIVQDGSETVFLKDTDGDGRADLRKLLISGWAMGDTHGGVSNFRYGLDNWIWAMQGYNNSLPVLHGREGETEQTQRFRQGFFRFRLDDGDPPVVTDLEFLRSTNNNTWGLGISEEGLIFGSTANRVPSVFMPIPNRYYEQVRGWTPSLTLDNIADNHLFAPAIAKEKVRQVDHHGGYTAGAGHALYTARRYPQQWWNRTAFVCGPTGKLVGTYVLQPQGAGFRSYTPINLVASFDEWSAPIMAEVGPDGNVWFIDWYNYIVQHNPTPRGFETGRGNAYATDLRDKKHGRIYRVVHGEEPSDVPNLADATSQQLVQTLHHSNMLWRLQAQRLLVERQDDSVVNQLVGLVQNRDVDAIGLNVGAIHGLWTLNALGALEEDSSPAAATAKKALSHPSAGVRRNAVAVLPKATGLLAVITEANLLADRDPQVRLAAFLAISELPASEAAGELVAAAFADPVNYDDPHIADAATSAAAQHAPSFLRHVAAIESPKDTIVQRTSIVAEHHARSGGDGINQLVDHLEEANPQLVAAIVEGWREGWSEDAESPIDEDTKPKVVALLDRLPPQSQTALIELGSQWKIEGLEEHLESITNSLLARIDDEAASDVDRIAAVENLVRFQSSSDDIVDEVLDRITAQASPQFAAGMIRSLSASQAPGLATNVVARLDGYSPSLKEAALRMLLQQNRTRESLVTAMEEGEFDPTVLTLDMRQSLTGGRDRRLARRAQEVLRRGGGLPSADRQAVIEELIGITTLTGNVANGQEMFKKHCAQCHVHGDMGERVGPDLTGMAVHPKTELLEQILDPSSSVEGNYRMYLVLVSGRTLQGLIAGESNTALELVDTEGKKHSILREDIDEDGLVASQKSVMPDGFEKQMTSTELADLLEFLTDRGKFVPLDLRKAATISSGQGMFFDRNERAERMMFSDWGPKQFNGVPFRVTDPEDGRVPNVVMLYSRSGAVPRQLPRSAELPVNMPAEAIHVLGGISGWGWPYTPEGSVSMIVRLHYKDGTNEDHELVNGVHLSDYIRRNDVDGSQYAFNMGGKQLRYLAIEPKRRDVIEKIELIKGRDATAPIVMAMTVQVQP